MTTFESDPRPLPGSATPLIPVRKQAKGRSGSSLLMGLAALVAVGGIAFAAGRVTAPAAATGSGRGAFAANGTTASTSGTGGFARNGALTVSGTVAAVGGGTITVKTAAGTDTTFATTGTTTYHTAAVGTASDAAVGSTVEIQMAGFGGASRTGTGTGAAGSPAPAASPAANPTATDVTVVAP